MNSEETIRRYFKCWLDKNGGPLPEIFADNAVYSECYGPEYHGLEQIIKWFTEWNRIGSVLEWTIKQFIHQGAFSVAEWYFKCDYNGEISEFNGVSLIEFDNNGKIVNLKEFKSDAEHYFPFGK
ncbi:MAG: nuclear transport factor 2 family protein [Eubacterium sp.]|nr:nuclear transport factor 2 family protein [Eubacterium sp.]